MAAVEQKIVEQEEAAMRLDRWFKVHYPGLGFGALQKLLRSGQVRIDGGRAKSDTRLVVGQTIRVHNDYIGGAETHRMLVQLNRGWDAANGGLLMLFDSDRAEDVSAVIIPRHGSALAFAISPKSFHAVSTIVSGARFTLVYTFRKP